VIETRPDGDQELAGADAAPGGEPDYAIEIVGMDKSYGRKQAVRNLTMRVPQGSIYGFVGPNGAGKTTTIRTLATLQKPDAGTVQVDGLDVVRHPATVRDRVGYMPDFFGVYDNLTVDEYLDFYAGSHWVPADRRAQVRDELLELVDLSDQRKEQVEWLSRGMKQRLGLARCLIHDPDVLLLDEPASGMDPRARIELREILRELSALNKTMLISSHILPELAEMCTHVGVIQSGELIAEGAVDAVIAQLSHGPRLRIRLLDPAHLALAREVLEADPSVGEVEAEEGGTLSGGFAGDDRDLSRLLAELMGRSCPVVEFMVDRGSLEDIFLHATAPGEENA
jgi:ABC-2 type transport system ATP-binding protein